MSGKVSGETFAIALGVVALRIGVTILGKGESPWGPRPDWVPQYWSWNRVTAPLWRDPRLMVGCVGGIAILGLIIGVDLLIAGRGAGMWVLGLSLPTPLQAGVYLPRAWRAAAQQR